VKSFISPLFLLIIWFSKVEARRLLQVQVIESAPRSTGLLGQAASEDNSPLGKVRDAVFCTFFKKKKRIFLKRRRE
jgi:hypothetical protein